MRLFGVLGVWGFGLSLLLALPASPFKEQAGETPNGIDSGLKSEFGLKNEEIKTIDFLSEETQLLEILGSLVGLSPSDISKIMSLTRVGLGVVDVLSQLFRKVFNGTEIDLSFLNLPDANRRLLSMFEIITLRLEQIQMGTTGIQRSLRALAEGTPYLIRWEIALNTLESYTRPINNLFYRFSFYQKHKMQVENHTLLDFAESVISHSTNSIQAMMASVHNMAAPNDPPILRGFEKEEYEIHNRVTSKMSFNLRRLLAANPEIAIDSDADDKMQNLSLRPSVFRMLQDAMDKYDTCRYDQSQQQLIYGLYSLLSLTMARGYSMMEFSYAILKLHKKGNFTIERRLAKELYTHYSRGMMRNAHKTLNMASSSFQRCDPKKHIEGETFEMVTELLQGYIENEVDMNTGGSCLNSCNSYKHAVSEGCFLPDKQYCGKHRRCKGTIHDCKFFDADAWVCISNLPYRRYDWVEYEDSTLLGHKQGSCNSTMKVDSWWRVFYHCSYCVCLCDDPQSPHSDRHVSLRPAISDITKGQVITGVRFVKKNGVLQIQVQQGKALPQGQIYPNTLRWMPSEDINPKTGKYVEFLDYFTFRYEARSIDLDQLKAPKGHVLTGIKFRTLGSHVNLEIKVTPINFSDGKLNPDLSYWMSNDNTPVNAIRPRRLVSLVNPDDSRRSPSGSYDESEKDTYVSLQATSLTSDVSQLTVPFFEATPVSPATPSWLRGAQLYHRGSPGYGGFIAFKVINYDLKRHFEDENKLDNEILL